MDYGNIYSSMGSNAYAAQSRRPPQGAPKWDPGHGGYVYPKTSPPPGYHPKTNPGDGPPEHHGQPPPPRQPGPPGGAPYPRSGQPNYGTPMANDPGFASPLGGPAGVGGSGGYGFTNLAQYMYANPAGSGTASNPGVGDYNAEMHGYAPNGAYSPGMSGVDNALNQVYSRGGPDDWLQPGQANQQSQPQQTGYPNIRSGWGY